MAEIVILGAGVMGSAFTQTAVDGGNRVRLVGTHLDEEWINEIRTTGFHPKLRRHLPESVHCYTVDQLGEALSQDTVLIVLGVSSAGVDWAVDKLGPLLKRPTPIVMLTKGLAACGGRLDILPNVVRMGLEGYGIKEVPVAAIGGPCIAGELAARRETSVVLAHSDSAVLDSILPLIKAPYYHVRPSLDLIGVEACAALKNFFALAVGYPAGLLKVCGGSENDAGMHNLSAGLFTQALSEMGHIVSHMGGASESVFGLAGAGDFYVTCQAGRNSRLGGLLGTGLRFSEAESRHMAGETVEGAELAKTIGPTLNLLMESGRLMSSALPLTRTIIDVVCRDKPMQIPWSFFFQGR